MKVNGLIVFITTAVILFTSSTSRRAHAIGHWFRCRNPFTKIECRFNDDCGSAEVCRDSRCVSACWGRECYNNEGCQVINHHMSSCECLPNFYRAPDGKCAPIKTCVDDKNCHYTEQCKNGKCISSCFDKTCAPNEGCQIIRPHISSCECFPNFKRNPSGVCIPNNVCSSDGDCDLTEICRQSQCVSACFKQTCSILNEACQVNNRHSSSCHCLPGYIRNTITKECKPICMDNTDCPSYQDCLMINHVPTCQCQPGYVHDNEPSDPCLKICSNDMECDDAETCESGKCKDACESVTCADNAICTATGHIGRCECYDGYTGDPNTMCSLSCTIDNDCSDSEKCNSGICVDACESVSCKPNSYCNASDHSYVCDCEIGYELDSITGDCT